MELMKKIKEFLEKYKIVSKKDNVLIVAVHHILLDKGFESKEIKSSSDEHEIKYTKENKDYILYGKREGENLKIELFEIEGNDKKKVSELELNLNEFVDDNMNIINEEKLKEEITKILP